MADDAQAQSGAAPLQVDAVLDTVLATIGRLLEGDGGSIMLLTGPEELEVVCSPSNEAALGARVRFGEGVAGQVAQTCDPVLVTGRAGNRRKPVDSGMCVPLMHDGRIFGILNVNARTGRTFTDHDLVVATRFARHAAEALAEARLYEVDRRSGAPHPEKHLDAMLTHLHDAALVDFSEPSQGEVVDAASLARTVAEGFDESNRPTGVRGPASVLVEADELQLRRLLTELIDNGHRHGSAPVRLIFEDDDEWVVLTVADGGPGVPEHDRAMIFAPFGRLPRSVVEPGLGLGLTIARRLAEALGGSLTVVDTPVGGAAFQVRLRRAG